MGHTQLDDGVRAAIRPRRTAIPELPRGARALPDDRRSRPVREALDQRPREAPRHGPRGRCGVRRHGQRRRGGVAPPARGRGRAGQARCGARGGSRREPRVGPRDGPDECHASWPTSSGRYRAGADPSLGRRGDIHLVGFEEIGGSVIRGPHPAVVVQTERLRRSSHGPRVPDLEPRPPAPATTFPRTSAWVSTQESGLDRDGWVKADQLFTRPIDTLGPRLGRLNPAAMTRVDASLRFVLGL